MTGTSSMGTETVRTDFMGLLGMHSSELKESTKNAERIVHIHEDGSDVGKACLSGNMKRRPKILLTFIIIV